MKVLYSNILPLGTEDGQQTVSDCFEEQMAKADHVEIAVGYVSRASLERLDELVSVCNIRNICLNIGMYYIEGMPEGSYHTAVKINRKWADEGIGEIRMVRAFKYHGKVYCFYKNGEPFSVIMGSANLGVIKLEASNRRQYELSILTTDPSECREMAAFVEKLKQPNCSAKISDISDMPLISEKNTALSGIELVTEVPPSNVDFYRRCAAYASFLLPLKVPASAERLIDDGRHFTKSNVNVCYAAPRSKRKSRDWYEAQLTVSKEITQIDGYPEKMYPSLLLLMMGIGSRHTPQVTAINSLVLSVTNSLWADGLKGALSAAGLVSPVNDTQMDTDRSGMITKEILLEYGCENLYFKKTGQTALDEDGNELDVWMLSFKPEDMEGDEE